MEPLRPRTESACVHFIAAVCKSRISHSGLGLDDQDRGGGLALSLRQAFQSRDYQCTWTTYRPWVKSTWLAFVQMGFHSWDVERGVCLHTRDGDDAFRAKHSNDGISRPAWAELGRTPQAADLAG